jgi:hypothetical protein
MRIPPTLLALAAAALVRSIPIGIPLSSVDPQTFPASSAAVSEEEVPLAADRKGMPVHRKRDGLWPWQKPQPVVGKDDKGRLICSIVTMTA